MCRKQTEIYFLNAFFIDERIKVQLYALFLFLSYKNNLISDVKLPFCSYSSESCLSMLKRVLTGKGQLYTSFVQLLKVSSRKTERNLHKTTLFV